MDSGLPSPLALSILQGGDSGTLSGVLAVPNTGKTIGLMTQIVCTGCSEEGARRCWWLGGESWLGEGVSCTGSQILIHRATREIQM